METALTLKTLARLSASGAIIVLPTLAHSFSASDDVNRRFSLSETGCSFSAYVNDSSSAAYVYMSNSSELYMANGAYYSWGNVVTYYDALPKSALAECLGSGLVIIHSQKMTRAARAIADRNTVGDLSYRVATLLQSFSLPNMISIWLRRL